MPVLGEAMDRLLGGLLLNVASKVGEPVNIAPRHEAAREYLTGLILMGQNKHLPSFQRAASLDTNFLYPALWLAEEADEATTDSLFGVFDRRRSQYSTYEACRITAAREQVIGNNENALAAIQEALSVEPGDMVATYRLISLAHATNRPLLGIRTYRALKVPPGWETSLAMEFQGQRVAAMYDWLGDYEGMLAHVEEMLTVWPGTNRILATKMAALTGLGRYAAVDSVTLELISNPGSKGQVPYVLEIALRHLAVRGRWEEARLMADRGHAWLVAQGPDDMDPDVVEYYRWNLEQHTNRWARLDSMVALDTDPYEDWYPHFLRFPGRAAAHLGDREKNRSVQSARRFANICLHEKAAIRAILGDKEEAVALLREAFRRGFVRHGYADPDPAFVGLYDYEPYVELMKPRG
jgi:tetratricopeptide (TPR) repeat protein